MPELAITHFLNSLFAGPVTALQALFHYHAENPAKPISNRFALEVLITLVLIAFFALVRVTLSVEKPGAIQQTAELISEFTGSQSEKIIGHDYPRYQSFVTSILLFVLLCNLIGLIPGFPAPTSAPEVPMGLALMTFLYYHFHGVRSQGLVKYVKHFAGPVWWLAVLFFPIEIISHLARLMSLTVRLYANMFAGDMVTLVFFSLIPIGVPVIFLGLHVGVSLIQAYVFMLLTVIYLSQAVAHDH